MHYYDKKFIHENINTGNIKIATEKLCEIITSQAAEKQINTLVKKYNNTIDEYIKEPNNNEHIITLRSIKQELHDICNYKTESNDYTIYGQYRRKKKLPSETEVQKLFYSLMLDKADNETADKISEMIDNPNEHWANKLIALSAVSLNLCFRFSPCYFTLLIRHSSNTDQRIAAKAIVGLTVAIALNNTYLTSDKALLSYFKSSISDSKNESLFYDTLMALIREDISIKYKKDIQEMMTPKRVMINNILGKAFNNKESINDSDLNELLDTFKETEEIDEEEEIKRIQKILIDLDENLIDFKYCHFEDLLKLDVLQKQFSDISQWFIPFDSEKAIKDTNNKLVKNMLYSLSEDPNSSDTDKLLLSSTINSAINILENKEIERIKNIQTNRNKDQILFSKDIYIHLYTRDIFRLFSLFKFDYSDFNDQKNDIQDFLYNGDFLKVFDNLDYTVNNILLDMIDLKQYSSTIKIAELIQKNIKPNDKDILNVLCIANNENNTYYAAHYYAQLLQLIDENDINAKLYLAKSLFNMGQYASATEVYKNTIALFPNSIELKLLYSTSLKYERKYDEASKVLFELYYIEPNNTNVVIQLIKALLLSNRPDDAITYLNNNKSNIDISTFSIHLAIALLLKGEPDEAAKAIKADPNYNRKLIITSFREYLDDYFVDFDEKVWMMFEREV